MKPLQGLKILDLTRVMAGPFCTALLADLGAEVIKLEPPQGDDYRHIGPFLHGESALFTLMNRGKQSIVLDLKDPAAVATARAAHAARQDIGQLSVLQPYEAEHRRTTLPVKCKIPFTLMLRTAVITRCCCERTPRLAK